MTNAHADILQVEWARSETALQLANEGPLMCPEPPPASASAPAASCPDLQDFDKLVQSAVSMYT